MSQKETKTIESQKETKAIKPKKIKKDDRIVRVRFRNYDAPGHSINVTFSDDEFAPLKYTLEDGKEYDLPYKVVKNINENCCYELHKNAIDEQGNPIVRFDRIKRVYALENYNFD